MPQPEKISHCEQCGAPLKSGAANQGCLNCLLLGGPNDSSSETSFQHYEICLRADGTSLDELGRGAMGITYRAVHVSLGSHVALKIISAQYSENLRARERFQREARAAAQLRHANVASVFHFGETPAGQCFYAMELVEGETLEARVRRDGPLPALLALEVAIQVARALTAAEAYGLVHRDLKPGNVMVVAGDPGGADSLVVKVIDFGLAKATSETPMISSQVNLGFSGTPDFASPEQLSAGRVTLDIRSDIYSLGATLWYLLCGGPPFADRAPREAREQPLPLQQLTAAQVPAPIISLLRSMLATDPASRPQSARELLLSLKRCYQVIVAAPRSRRQRALIGLALALIGGSLGYVFWSIRPGADLSRARSDGNGKAGNRLHSASARPPIEEEKILLGEIATIPFQELYEALSGKRPEEIAHLAQQLHQLPPDQKAQAKIKTFYRAWAHLDAKASFESALTFLDPAGRDAAAAAAIEGADAGATGAIAAYLLTLPGDKLSDFAKRTLFEQTIQKWSEADPAAAAGLLSDSKLQGYRTTPVYVTVATNWAKIDPTAALAWAQEQGGLPPGMNPVLGAVLGWWKKDPAAAEAYAFSQADTPLGNQLISVLATQMVYQDRAQATAWVRTIPNEEVRRQAYATMATNVAFSDPKGAIEWALSLPDGAWRGALSSSVSMWAESDSVAAAHWMEGLDSGDMRDTAVSSFSYSIEETDPQAAIEWAVTISDNSSRALVTRRVMNQWLRQNPTTARTWIQNSSLGDAEKARLLATPSPSPHP